jgi:hypothetical protein
MKKIVFIGLVLILIGCQKKVELVQAVGTIDSTIVDHSPVYMFFETKGNDTIIEINRKNTIGTTNWIFNIDKRLPLKLAIPEIIKLQEKRRSPQMHENKAASDYYSYMDSVQKSLAFMRFRDINYTYDNYFSTIYVKENPDYHIHFQTFAINFKLNNKVSVDGNDVEMKDLLSFLKEYIEFSSENKQILLYLNFDERLTFDQYLSKVIELKALENDKTSISKTHFIYNLKKLPDCDCAK